MAEDAQHNVVVRTDIKLSRCLAICSEPTIVYGRGKQIFRGIARGTQPCVVLVWLVIWILATHEAALHERLVNMFVGSLVGWALCSILKLIFKRPRPLLTGGTPGQGIAAYSFPSAHAMIYTLAYYMVTNSFKGNYELMMLMKAVLLVICLTHIMLGRLYILDILGGLVMGMIAYQLLIRFLWISTIKSEPIIKSVQAALHLYR